MKNLKTCCSIRRHVTKRANANREKTVRANVIPTNAATIKLCSNLCHDKYAILAHASRANVIRTNVMGTIVIRPNAKQTDAIHPSYSKKCLYSEWH
jgi:hypothetical protein